MERIDNRFDLVLVAAHRAHMLRHGSSELLPWDNDKPTVLALREIAAGKVTPDILDRPLREPDEDVDSEELDALRKTAAERELEDFAEHDDDEDLDEDFDAGEEGEAELSPPAADGDPAGEAQSPVAAERPVKGA